MSTLSAKLYNLVFRKTSTYVLGVCVGVFFYERTIDFGADYLFDTINKGKQWKDIQHLYGVKKEEE